MISEIVSNLVSVGLASVFIFTGGFDISTARDNLLANVGIETDGIILLGDSRFVGIDNAVEQADNVFFVAKVGEGYSWFVETAIPQIEDIREDNPYITDWTIVTGLGVNDLSNVSKYENKYEELLEGDWSDVTLYYMSVNPVDESKCYTVKNSNIRKFNKHFSDEENYIDTYGYVLDHMETNDGLHFGKTINKKLYSLIMEGIE